MKASFNPLTKEDYNFFIRYLKEKGLFSEFCYEIRRQIRRRQCAKFQKSIYARLKSSTQILMDYINWTEARYKDENGCNGWAKIYHDYVTFKLKYEIKECTKLLGTPIEYIKNTKKR